MNNNKYSILEIANQCSYPINMRDLIVNVIYELTLSSNSVKYSKMTWGTDSIISLKYNVSASFGKTRNYDIPIIINFIKNYPYEPPQIFLDLGPNLGVNPKNSDIDQTTNKIITPSLKNWNQFSNLKFVITEIQKSFHKNFPIYKVTNKTQNVNNINKSTIVNSVGGISLGESIVFGYNNNNNDNKISQSVIGNSHSSINYPYNNSDYTAPPSQNSWQNQQGYNSSFIFNNQNVNSGSKDFQDEEIKKILILNIKTKIEQKIKDEKRRLNQQEEKLKNYKNQFSVQLENLNSYVNNKDKNMKEVGKIMENIDTEIRELGTYNAKMQDRVVNTSNFMNCISIENEKVIHLISLEATVEDLISLTKKALEKSIISFSDALKFIRMISRETFKIKFEREKYVKKLNFN
jgi:hypothetical protein